ncbi:AAA family ATPase [Mammaliicoccus sciuri]|uniref:AAA family ATPase n=1 Tax=Mammaliicoccus sciuri TaxID=1296 RepID=UPI0034DD1491
MSDKTNILAEFGIEELSEDSKKFYSIIAYGKSGTGKTTLATREGNALVIDINEDGTRVAKKGFMKSVSDYNDFRKLIANISNIITAARDAGKPIDVVVIETAQKLRDITLNHVLNTHQKKTARIQDYGETAKLIINSIRYLLKVKDKLGFHIVLTGHEGINSEDKDENGNIINPRISIEVQSAIHNNLVTQFDIIGHTTIEDVTDEEGNATHNYVFSVEPSKLYTTKVRHNPDIKISQPNIKNASITKIVDLAQNGN